MLVPAMRWKPIVLWSLAAGLLINAVVVFVAFSSKTWRQVRLENRTLGFERRYEPLNTAQAVTDAWKLWMNWNDLMGPEDRWTLMARSNYALALLYDNQRVEWEKETRDLIKLESRLFGPVDGPVLWGREHLASSLDYMKRYADAEVEWRALLRACTDERGVVLFRGGVCLSYLQDNLDKQEKYEAEAAVLRTDLQRLAPLAAEQRARGGSRPLPMEPDYPGDERRLQQRLKLVEEKALAKRDYETALSKLGAEHDDTKRLKMRLEELKKTKL